MNAQNSNKSRYDDGLIYIWNVQSEKLIYINFIKPIDKVNILCQELGEILHYVSLNRPLKIIISLDELDDFFTMYEKISLDFFRILPMLGIKKIAFISSKYENELILRLVKPLPIQCGVFKSKDASKAWIST